MKIESLSDYKGREQLIESLIKENEELRKAMNEIIDNSVVIEKPFTESLEIQVKEIKITLEKDDPCYIYALGVYKDRQRRREQ